MARVDPVQHLRERCLALPETTERPSHGEAAWFVRDKKLFVALDQHHSSTMFATHRGGPVTAFWCAAPPGAQGELIAEEPERFFRPPYVGHRGWLGVRIDLPDTDWDEIAEIVTDAYRKVAPKTLAARLDAPPA